jgi:hypothetical protein
MEAISVLQWVDKRKVRYPLYVPEYMVPNLLFPARSLIRYLIYHEVCMYLPT